MDREYPGDRGHFPQIIVSSDLKALICQHGECQPRGPFKQCEKDGRPAFSKTFYSSVSKGNMSANRTWLCYSPLLQKRYCQTCWLFAARGKFKFAVSVD